MGLGRHWPWGEDSRVGAQAGVVVSFLVPALGLLFNRDPFAWPSWLGPMQWVLVLLFPGAGLAWLLRMLAWFCWRPMVASEELWMVVSSVANVVFYSVGWAALRWKGRRRPAVRNVVFLAWGICVLVLAVGLIA